MLVACGVSHDSLPLLPQCIQKIYMGKAAAGTEQHMTLQQLCAVQNVGLAAVPSCMIPDIHSLGRGHPRNIAACPHSRHCAESPKWYTGSSLDQIESSQIAGTLEQDHVKYTGTCLLGLHRPQPLSLQHTGSLRRQRVYEARHSSQVCLCKQLVRCKLKALAGF